MADKKAKPKVKGKPVRRNESVADVANEIWKAGLGALRKAEKEGSKIFKSLVDMGDDFQTSRRKSSEKQIDKVSKVIRGGVGSVKGKIDDITFQRENIWDKLKLEQTFGQVMKTFGVATKKEIDVLKKKMDTLQKSVNELKGKK